MPDHPKTPRQERDKLARGGYKSMNTYEGDACLSRRAPRYDSIFSISGFQQLPSDEGSLSIHMQEPQ